MTFGFAIGTPAALSLLQSCTSNDTSAKNRQETAKLHFFDAEEATFIAKTVDIIIPPTDNIPGATDVGVPEFIDQYMDEVVSKKEQKLTKNYLSNIITNLKEEIGKEEVASFTADDIEPIIDESLNKSPEEEKYIMEEVNTYIQAVNNGKKHVLINDVAAYAFLTNLRQLTIWSFKNSREIGEDVLAYDTVPGRQEGCISVQQATGGRAWSL